MPGKVERFINSKQLQDFPDSQEVLKECISLDGESKYDDFILIYPDSDFLDECVVPDADGVVDAINCFYRYLL